MAEALNDGNAALGTHIVSFHPLGGTQQPSLQPRHHQHHLLSPIQLAMGPVPADAQAAGVRRSFSGLRAALAKANWPAGNVHLLSMAWLACDKVLVRLAHIFEVSSGIDTVVAMPCM
jgi:hypothetical protein